MEEEDEALINDYNNDNEYIEEKEPEEYIEPEEYKWMLIAAFIFLVTIYI